MESRRGFTLLEILVSIGIFAVIAGMLVIRFGEANKKAKISKAQKDLEEFKIAIEILYQDTREHPNHTSLSPCVLPGSTTLDLCNAGLICTDGAFSGWSGPYITNVQLDPWDQQYRFNSRYTCNGGTGCEGVAGGTNVRAVHSDGEDGAAGNADDIVSVICR